MEFYVLGGFSCTDWFFLYLAVFYVLSGLSCTWFFYVLGGSLYPFVSVTLEVYALLARAGKDVELYRM